MSILRSPPLLFSLLPPPLSLIHSLSLPLPLSFLFISLSLSLPSLIHSIPVFVLFNWNPINYSLLLSKEQQWQETVSIHIENEGENFRERRREKMREFSKEKKIERKKEQDVVTRLYHKYQKVGSFVFVQFTCTRCPPVLLSLSLSDSLPFFSLSFWFPSFSLSVYNIVRFVLRA